MVRTMLSHFTPFSFSYVFGILMQICKLEKKKNTSDDETIYDLGVGESFREGICADSSSVHPPMLVIPKLISATNLFTVSLPVPTGGCYGWVSSQITQSTPKPELSPRLRNCSRPEFPTSEKIPPRILLLKQEFLPHSSLYLISLCLPAPLSLVNSVALPFFIPIPFSPSFFDCQSSACITFYIKSEIPLTNSLSLISLPIIHFPNAPKMTVTFKSQERSYSPPSSDPSKAPHSLQNTKQNS